MKQNSHLLFSTLSFVEGWKSRFYGSLGVIRLGLILGGEIDSRQVIISNDCSSCRGCKGGRRFSHLQGKRISSGCCNKQANLTLTAGVPKRTLLAWGGGATSTGAATDRCCWGKAGAIGVGGARVWKTRKDENTECKNHQMCNSTSTVHITNLG